MKLHPNIPVRTACLAPRACTSPAGPRGHISRLWGTSRPGSGCPQGQNAQSKWGCLVLGDSPTPKKSWCFRFDLKPVNKVPAEKGPPPCRDWVLNDNNGCEQLGGLEKEPNDLSPGFLLECKTQHGLEKFRNNDSNNWNLALLAR